MGRTPTFSWSWTRADTLERCARRYLYRYYLAAGGWSPSANQLARAAYRLKQLRTLWMILGAALHDRAREVAAAARTGTRVPSIEELECRTRRALNDAVRIGRSRRSFEADPVGRPMLLEVYRAGALTPEYITRIADRLVTATHHLACSQIWEEVRSRPPSDIVLVEPLSSFAIDGVTVWAAPDLVYRAADGEVVLVDWKLGRAQNVERQLAVYALLIERGLRFSDADAVYRGLGVGLADGGIQVAEIGPAERAQAVQSMRRSVGEMRSLLRDVDANEPLAIDAFPRTTRWSECQRCCFLELCAPEIERDLSGVHEQLDLAECESPLHRGRDVGAQVTAAETAPPDLSLTDS